MQVGVAAVCRSNRVVLARSPTHPPSPRPFVPLFTYYIAVAMPVATTNADVIGQFTCTTAADRAPPLASLETPSGSRPAPIIPQLASPLFVPQFLLVAGYLRVQRLSACHTGSHARSPTTPLFFAPPPTQPCVERVLRKATGLTF